MTDKVEALGPAEEKSSKIKDIEPLLKWGAVAYGGGFLTVMLHTWRLGVPVMQLIEPVYILVGAPLAVTLFFVEPLIAAFKRKRELLRQEMNAIDQYLDTLRAVKTPQEAAQEALRALAEMFDMLMAAFKIVGPVEIIPVSFAKETLMPYLQKTLDKSLETSDTEKARSYLVTFSLRLNFANRTVMAFFRFGLRLLPLALILLAVVFYTIVVYPAFPQSLGGGKPSQARLIVDVKKIPLDDANLRTLFPQSPPENKASDISKTESGKPESQITCSVALLYETEHAYYIRRGQGTIVVIDHDAVNGMIFSSAKESKQQGCT